MYELTLRAREADDAFISLSRTWAQFYWTSGNKYGYQKVQSGIDDIRDKVTGISPASGFEKLWLSDINHQLDVQEALARHYHGHPTMPVTELLDFACGPGTYKLIEDTLLGYDYEAAWMLDQEDTGARRSSIPTNTREACEIIEAYAPKIKNEVLRFGIEQGYLPEGFDFCQDLSLPGTHSRPFWNTEHKRFFLGYDYFQCFDEDGRIRLNPVTVYICAFHEILGHASHQVNSEHLPRSSQLCYDTRLNIASRVVAEGIAQHRERLAFDWLRQNAERLGLKTDEIELAGRHRSADYLLVDPAITLGVLKEREAFEGLNIKEYVQQLESNPRVVFRFSDPLGSGTYGVSRIETAFFEICYPAGYKTVGNIMKKFDHVADKRRLNKACSTGAWGWKTYPLAVEHFLENEPTSS